MKKILSAVVAVIMIGAGGLYYFRGRDEGPNYRTVKASRGDVVSAVTATGNVNAVTTVLVGTQVSGTIKGIHADYNSAVRKGQLIAEIDPATFEAQVAQARANLLAAEANLEKAKAAADDSARTLERNRTLFARNLIARSDLDTAATNHETSRANVSSAKAQIEQTKAALNFAEINLRNTRITSPVDGIVVSRSVDVGQTVAASFQTPTLFTIAEDLTKMQIDSSVVEADIGRVVLGQQVDFTVDAYPDTTFKGRVSEIRIAPIVVQNVVTYDVVVRVANPDLKLKPGMTANISIITSSKSGVLRVPNSALRFRPPENNGNRARKEEKKEERGGAVWVLRQGKPEKTAITAGITDGNFTEVISGALKEGDDVIIEALKARNKPQGQAGPRMF